MSLQEYEIDDKNIAEWLPWGALVRDGVMRNKDDSLCAFIAYRPYEHEDIPSPLNIQRDFVNGWSLWTEWQHTTKINRFVMTVCWNPFRGMLSSDIQNTLENDDAIPFSHAADYFYDVVKGIASELEQKTDVQILTYQDIFEFLSFSLSFEEQYVEMPSVPLYMDCLLSQNLNFEFRENDILLNHKFFVLLSLPGTFEPHIMQSLFHAFETVPFRYVERLLIFGQEEAQDQFRHYIQSWADGRKTVKRVLQQHILNELSGYYAKTFVFLLDENLTVRIKKFIQQCADRLMIPYIIESYNLKDIWWGTLPGLFRANLNPPIMGFNSLESFLMPPLFNFEKQDENQGTKEPEETDEPAEKEA